MIFELLKPDPSLVLFKARRELEDRTMGVFYRLGGQAFPTPSGPVEEAQALRELAVIPDPYTPLLTHLQPKELVMFLVSGDAARRSMLSINAPSRAQRIDSVRGLHSSKMKRSWESYKQHLSAWEGALSNSSTVSLDSTMVAIQTARKEQSALLHNVGQRDP